MVCGYKRRFIEARVVLWRSTNRVHIQSSKATCGIGYVVNLTNHIDDKWLKIKKVKRHELLLITIKSNSCLLTFFPMSDGTSPVIGITQCYLLPDTSERTTPQVLNPSLQATRFYRGGTEGWLRNTEMMYLPRSLGELIQYPQDPMTGRKQKRRDKRGTEGAEIFNFFVTISADLPDHDILIMKQEI